MRYIRYLKTPKTDGRKLTALVTITSDLGDSFLADEVALVATVRSAEPHGDIYLRKSLKWTPGMRSLPISFDLTSSDLDWPVRMHVGPKNGGYFDHFEKHHASGDLPSLISAWSDVLDPEKGITEAEKRVERRFIPLSNRTLSIWEETGESIARHLWDAGIALTAYFDHTVALQAESIPLLEQVLSSATYKKLNVIELGSGCGIVGIGLAQTVPDCDVVLTDLSEAEEIVRHNIAIMNPAISSTVTFQALDWERPLPAKIQERPFDMVLVADCTYNPDSSPALVKTLSALVKRSPKAIVVVAMKVRHESESVFFDCMQDAALVTESCVVLPLPRNEEWSDDREHVDLYVFRGKGRPYLLETPTIWVG